MWLERKKFYLDTSVWRDYFEDRSDGLKPLGLFAFEFLEKCKNRNWTIFISPKIEQELAKDYSQDKINDCFSRYLAVIIKIQPTIKELKVAQKIWIKTNKRFPMGDIIHSVLAKNRNAILISRDWHFKDLNLVESEFPEEID